MNFYSNKLKAKKYFDILKKYPKSFSKRFIIKNFGIFLGDKSFYRILACYELLNQTKKIKGDVVEFGIWNGNNLFAMKKMIDFLKIKKKVIGYDNFKGFPNPVNLKNKKSKKKHLGVYAGDQSLIKYIIKFYKLKNVKIINDDIFNLKNHLNLFSKLSFIYIDCNIYETTVEILDLLGSKLSVGGIIAFDEGTLSKTSGEGKAIHEFYLHNKKKYKKIILKKFYQPDIYLKKIK
jgi:hypothetical protein